MGINVYTANAQPSGISKTISFDQNQKVHSNDSLIRYYQTALSIDENNVDLLNKLGSIYFSRHDYRKAVKEFERALTIEPKNDLALKYHYWSALNSGLTSDARKTLRKMSPYQLTEVSEKKPSVFQQIDLGTGVLVSNNFDKNGDVITLDNDSIYASQALDGNMLYNYIGLKINPIGWLSLYFSYQNLIINKWQQELIQDYIVTDSTYEYTWNGTDYYRQIFTPSPVLISKKYNLYQNQFYFNAELNPGNGWSIIPSFHYLKFKHEPFYVEYGIKEFQALPFDTINTVVPVYNIVNFSETFEEWAAGLSIYKDIGDFNLSAYYVISNIANNQNEQNGILVTWFPYGNLDLYGSVRYDLLSGEKEDKSVYGATIGGKLLSTLWGEAGFVAGNLQSFTDKNTYIIYNTINQSDYKIHSNLTWVLNQHFNVQFRYVYSQMKEELKVFPIEKDDIGKPSNIYNPYQTHSLIAGISWKI